MSLDKKCNYEVGYAKPPDKSRFKKGQSGNPTGRVKGRRTYRSSCCRHSMSQ